MAKKKRNLDTTTEHQKMYEVYRSWSMSNFLPVFPDGEDEETMQDHSEQLRQKPRVSKKKNKILVLLTI